MGKSNKVRSKKVILSNKHKLPFSFHINILDKDYIQWIKDLSSRYRRSQIKASVKVNQEMLQFYWELGKDIGAHRAWHPVTQAPLPAGFFLFYDTFARQ